MAYMISEKKSEEGKGKRKAKGEKRENQGKTREKPGKGEM